MTVTESVSALILPRSPREEMQGWVHLPRFIDKLRLNIAGKLPLDYQENLLHKGFDKLWLDSAEVDAETFHQVVRNSITDGEVCDWVRLNVKKTVQDKENFRNRVLHSGQQNDEVKQRLQWRKEQCGLTERDDIKYFVDLIDAEEGRE